MLFLGREGVFATADITTEARSATLNDHSVPPSTSQSFNKFATERAKASVCFGLLLIAPMSRIESKAKMKKVRVKNPGDGCVKALKRETHDAEARESLEVALN